MLKRLFSFGRYAHHQEQQLDALSIQKNAVVHIKVWHIVLLGSLEAFAPLATDLYVPALPTVSTELGATISQTQITLSACILGLALGQLVAGPLSDIWGRRRPLLIGLAAFVVVSLLCSLAFSIEVLSGLRFLQGAAGAASLAIAVAVASDLYSGTTLARCLALLLTVNALAPIVAPIIGSQMLTLTSWRGLFVTLALVGVLVLLATAWKLPETLPLGQRQSNSIVTLVKVFASLFTNRDFLGYAFSSGFAFAAGIVYISVSPFVLQNLYGLSPQLFGVVTGFNALGLAIMSHVSGRLVNTVLPKKLLNWGAILIMSGGVSLLFSVLVGLGLWGILPSLFLVVASLGLIAPNAATLALSRTSSAGSGAALLGALQLSIGAIVAPLVGLSGSESAFPMAIVITVFGVATLIVTWGLAL